jgi:PAS domain S-box-containing protein
VRGAVLVVDDQPDSLRLIVDTLRQEQFEVRPANSGQLALASLAVKPADLILLDIHMPGMDGFEVCRRVKADAKIADIPVMFMSAATAIEEHIECFRVGAVAFVNKPIVREELVARIRAHVELARLRKRLEAQVAERTRALQAAYEQLERELRDREHAERALRESEQRFRIMADTAPVMIWVSGPDALVTFLNKEWLEFTGRTMAHEVGNGWTEGVHPDDLDHCLTTYRRSFDARRKFEMEYRLRRSDGEYRWLLDTGVPRFTPTGEFAGYIGSCVDMTEFKRSHEQRLAVQKMESLGALAAGIAHDFNNLLASVLAESDLALSELEPDSGSRPHIERISAVAVRASEIVDLLMAYAGTKSSPELQRVNVTDVIEEVLDLIGPSLSNNAVRLSHTEMYAGSTVRAGDYVRITIADTGQGMTDEAMTKAFDPFFSTKFIGRGLGLPVVQGIVRSHGGFIRVLSKPNSGTVFHVLLPAAREVDSSSQDAAGAWD